MMKNMPLNREHFQPILVLAILLVILLAGCGSSAASSASTPGADAGLAPLASEGPGPITGEGPAPSTGGGPILSAGEGPAASNSTTANEASSRPTLATPQQVAVQHVTASPVAVATVQSPAVAVANETAANQEATSQTVDATIRTARTLAATTVYAEPNASATVLGELKAASLVVITESTGGWYKIMYIVGAHRYGWLPQAAVNLAIWSDSTPAPTPTPAPAATGRSDVQGTVPAPKPSVRSNPNTAQTAATSASAKTSSSGLAGALVLQESSGGAIYAYNLATQSLRLLTGGFDPALSPDGSVVAFTRQGGEQGLYLIDIDGSHERLIFSGSDSPRAPSWSPDSRYILFSRVAGYSYCRQMGPRCVPDRPGLDAFPLKAIPQYGLSRVDRNGNDFRDIPALNSAEAPDWNEAGIVYQSSSGIQATADLPEATSRLVVSGYNYQDPDWQPGGGRIVFQSKQGNHWEIFAVNPDGSGLVALTRPASTLVDEFPQNVSPAWSPDGQAIVFLSNRAADGSVGAWRLWVMNADGSNQRLLDANALGQIAFRYDFHADKMVDWR